MDGDQKFWLRCWALAAALLFGICVILWLSGISRREALIKGGMVLCPLPGTSGGSESWMPADKCFDYSQGGSR